MTTLRNKYFFIVPDSYIALLNFAYKTVKKNLWHFGLANLFSVYFHLLLALVNLLVSLAHFHPRGCDFLPLSFPYWTIQRAFSLPPGAAVALKFCWLSKTPGTQTTQLKRLLNICPHTVTFSTPDRVRRLPGNDSRQFFSLPSVPPHVVL